jgi:CRP-like cAMP-binding protein
MNTAPLKSAFKGLNPQISEREWVFLEKCLLQKELKRKDCLFEAGQLQGYIGFINQGLVREYLIDKEGNEHTVWFFRENSFVTDYPSFIRNTPTKNTFRCLETCELILIPREAILESYEVFPAFERFGRLIAENVLIQLQDRIDDFHFLSAEERYLKYIQANPDLFQRISLTQLSSFLGIRRASLSRIRKYIS